MSNQVIHTDGEDVLVREDTAKAFRGVNWALASILAFVFIAGVLMIIFFWSSAKDGSVDSPSQIEQKRAP
jgi:hypothetical protein